MVQGKIDPGVVGRAMVGLPFAAEKNKEVGSENQAEGKAGDNGGMLDEILHEWRRQADGGYEGVLPVSGDASSGVETGDPWLEDPTVSEVQGGFFGLPPFDGPRRLS